MESKLTFGEYMRRLRREHKWNLSTLSERSKLSYTQLSRLENDSVVPTVASVAQLAQALDGDLKAMLEMADCLPRIILDRISAEADPSDSTLLRSAGFYDSSEAEPPAAIDHPLVEQIKANYGLDDGQAAKLALAIDGLVGLEAHQRASFFILISSMTEQRMAEG